MLSLLPLFSLSSMLRFEKLYAYNTDSSHGKLFELTLIEIRRSNFVSSHQSVRFENQEEKVKLYKKKFWFTKLLKGENKLSRFLFDDIKVAFKI